MFDLLMALRHFVKIKKQVRIDPDKAEEILRNGMAYAFEIGTGAPLVAQIDSTPGNPFLNPSWRNNVLAGSE